MAALLANPNLKLIIFGGKGGTGKTTSAAAAALHFHGLDPKKRILVISTDPAHSLGDSFDIAIGNKMTPVVQNVWALEIDANQLYQEHMERNGDVIKEIANRGTVFDRDDIESFFAQSLPGLDELMAITKIADLLKAGKYGLIILDTAPTGHTLVLLSLPERMEQFAGVMELMMDKYHYVLKSLTRRDKRDECDQYIAAQKEDVRRVRQLLSNATASEFVPVTIPEPMSIFETERSVKGLREHNIAVNSIIVNRVIEERRECPFCSARWGEKEGYVREIREKFAAYNLVWMPLFPHDIGGTEGLTEYSRLLFSEAEYKPAPAKVEFAPQAFSLPRGNLRDLLEREAPNLIIFGGKGGVGKTTVAAANALYLAGHNPDKKVLVFSADPAHSLSDSFEQHIGREITPISGVSNLYALEIDAPQMLEDFKQEYRDDVRDAFRQMLGARMDLPFDREIIEKLIDVIPPGVEELMALKRIMDLRKEGEYDIYVMDSAPSGHLIRLLELPHLIRDWLKAIFKVLLKYKGVVKLTGPTERLVELSRDIRITLDALANPLETEFVMVTIPEKMGVAEMGDLSASVANLKVPSRHTIINMIIPPSECGFCAAKRRNQQKHIEEIVERLRGQTTVIPIPLLPHDIRGLEHLGQLAEIMYAKVLVDAKK